MWDGTGGSEGKVMRIRTHHSYHLERQRRLLAAGGSFFAADRMRASRALVLALILLLAAGVCLTAQRADRQTLLPDDVVVERDIQYGRGADIPLLLDIYRPKETPKKPMPAIVFIHGGGWRGGSKSGFKFAGELVGRGYVAASIDYRLSGVAKFPAAVEDCKCAVRWLRANAAKYNVDPNRIGVWGGSAGGHLSLMVACADAKAGLEGNGGSAGVSSRVQAACSWFGPTDLSKRRSDFEGGAGAAVVIAFIGATPEEKPELYKQASPISYVSKDDPPILLVHGDADRLVPIAQSEAMLAELKRAGVEASLIRVKNGGHGFMPVDAAATEPSLQEIVKRTIDFFDKHLKPKSGGR